MGKRKKAIIQTGIEAQDAYYREKNAKELAEAERRQADAIKPNLLSRFASILLDIFMIGALFAGLFATVYFAIFPEIGYTSLVNSIRADYAQTGLYHVDDNGITYSLVEYYDATQTTPSEFYDGPITTYYTTDDRCIAADCYATYCEAKLESGLFEMVGDELVEKSDLIPLDFKEFYEAEYDKALSFSAKDPEIIRKSNQALLYMIGTFFILGTLSSCVFYLVVPLFTKNHETIGQMAFKLSLGSLSDGKPVGKKEVVIRYFVLLVVNIWLPISLYILDGALIGIPLFTTAACIAFTSKSASLHDFISKSRVRKRVEGDPFEALKTAAAMAEQEAAMRGE